MCGTCGCGEPQAGASQAHDHAGPEARRVAVERSLLEANEAEAARVRARLRAQHVEAIGLLGGPGAGKTSLLEQTLARLGPRAQSEAVIEGDCATDLDARRIAAFGTPVVQITTGSLCHLDAHRVEHALQDLELSAGARLWIENVGNLVCPAPFSCGETRRAVLISVTEGDDKPQKYPALIAAADLLVMTKSDLLPHVDFDPECCRAAARRVRPDLPMLLLSARSGEGLDAWMDWVRTGGA